MFRINEPGKDPGFGQSILHENQFVFHTPPYNSQDVYVHDPSGVWGDQLIKANGAKVMGHSLIILKNNIN